MKTNKINVYKILGISCIISLVVLITFSTRTSPVYSFLMGDYNDNQVSASILAGYRWLRGMIPYRDLFVTEGPVYLFIQGLGYLVAGRYGILFLQWINMSLVLFILLLLGKERSLKVKIFSLGLGLVMYAALCSGGDSTAEWMLLGITLLLFLDEGEKGHPFIMGIILGLLPLISLEGMGVSLGFLFVQLFLLGREKSLGKMFFLSMISGIMIPWVLFSVYFLCMGAFGEFLKAVYLIPMKMAYVEMKSIAQMSHKVVKCLLMAVPVLLVILANKKQLSKDVFSCCLWGAMLTIWLFILPNSWYLYLISIPFVCMAIMKYMDRMLLVAVAAVVTLVILIIPAKNYLAFLLQGTQEESCEFMEDLKAYVDENLKSKILLLNTDCTFYLAGGLCPDYKYYYDQTELASVDGTIYAAVNDILYGENSPACIVNTVKGQYYEEYYEGYTMIAAYIKYGGNLQIYIAD